MNPCAWCLKEQNIPPNPKDSHGICPDHVAQIRAEIKKRKEDQS